MVDSLCILLLACIELLAVSLRSLSLSSCAYNFRGGHPWILLTTRFFSPILHIYKNTNIANFILAVPLEIKKTNQNFDYEM